jgi:hypothetical protein
LLASVAELTGRRHFQGGVVKGVGTGGDGSDSGSASTTS